MKDIAHFEEIQIVDSIEKCFFNYGCVDFILNDDDIKALKNGKIINASIASEYAITLRYEESKNES